MRRGVVGGGAGLGGGAGTGGDLRERAGRVDLDVEWAGGAAGLGFGAQMREGSEGGVEEAGTPPTFRAEF